MEDRLGQVELVLKLSKNDPVARQFGKIVNLIGYFEENPILIAYDMRVFTLYPYNNKDIEWQKMLQTFDFGSVKSSKSGVLGRILTTSNDINIASLNAFAMSVSPLPANAQ